MTRISEHNKATNLAVASPCGAAHARRNSIARELHPSGSFGCLALAAARDRGDGVLVPRAARQHAVDDERRRDALPRTLSIRGQGNRSETTYGELGPDLAETDVDVAPQCVRDQEHDAHRGVGCRGLDHQRGDAGVEPRGGVAHCLAHGAREHRQPEDDHQCKDDVEGD